MKRKSKPIFFFNFIFEWYRIDGGLVIRVSLKVIEYFILKCTLKYKETLLYCGIKSKAFVKNLQTKPKKKKYVKI